jgi:prepilin-type N-terminal cleavage/methylation domain-containing protein
MSLPFPPAHDDLRQASLPEVDPLRHSYRCPFSGFSVVELLVVLAVFGIVSGMVFSSMGRGQETADIAKQEGFMTANLEDIFALFNSEIRTMGFPPESYFDSEYLQNPATPKNLVSHCLISMGPLSMEFEGDINGNGKVDYVRYYLTGSSPPYALSRFAGEIHTDGSLPGGSAQKLSEQVENLEFAFFNRSGIPAASVTEVTSIEIRMTLRSRNRDPISKIYRTINQITRIHPSNL